MSLTTIDKQDIKVMIRDGIAHLPTKAFVHQEISRLESKFGGLESKLGDVDNRVYRVEVLLEDTNSTVKHMIEMLSDNLRVKAKVDNIETRLTDIEVNQPGIISTLAAHSKQLKV